MDYYELFLLLKSYLNAEMGLPENLLLRLIDGRSLDLEDSLYYMSIIHRYYVQTLLEEEKPNGK
jgi:hypothetical protein